MNSIPHARRCDRARFCVGLATVLASTIVLGFAPHAHADTPVASVQLREGEPIGDGHEVTRFFESHMSPGAAWAFRVSSNDENDNGLQHYFGSVLGAPGGFIQTLSTIGEHEQTALWSFGFSDDGDLFYAARIDDGTSLGLESVCMNDDVLAIEDEPSGINSTFWYDFAVADVTADGVPFVRVSLAPSARSDPMQHALVFGTDLTPLLLGGQSVPNVPSPLHMFAGFSDFTVSAQGTSYITVARSVDDSHGDGSVVINGEGLMLGGALVRTDTPVPASVGGLPGEEWVFRHLDINEAGDYLIGGPNSGVPNGGYLLKNGEIIYREGDIVDGEELYHIPYDATLNEDGDIAFVWRHGFTGPRTLFINGKRIIGPGDGIDWTNNGIINDGFTLLDIDINSGLQMSDRLSGGLVVIVFSGEVETSFGGVRDAIFRMEIDLEPDVFSIADFVNSNTFQPPPDGQVDGADLAFLLGEWGKNPGSPADIVDSKTFEPPPDGVVNGADLAVLLGEWSP